MTQDISNKPLFSLITPTLQRASLVRCCQSLDQQSFQSWEHLIFVDAERVNDEVDALGNDFQRHILCNNVRYGDFGNTPRRRAWRHATGTYVIYLDDDNYFSSPESLTNIASQLAQASLPPWAIFPILRFGSIFCDPSPGVCHTDSANMVIRWEYAEWPDRRDYTADGILAEQLVREQPGFRVFFDCPPIITVPIQSKGE